MLDSNNDYKATKLGLPSNTLFHKVKKFLAHFVHYTQEMHTKYSQVSFLVVVWSLPPGESN